ncbi:hypothetical protein TNIN_182271, partial [Trichonephila inaurata madagascariensis]
NFQSFIKYSVSCSITQNQKGLIQFGVIKFPPNMGLDHLPVLPLRGGVLVKLLLQSENEGSEDLLGKNFSLGQDKYKKNFLSWEP